MSVVTIAPLDTILLSSLLSDSSPFPRTSRMFTAGPGPFLFSKRWQLSYRFFGKRPCDNRRGSAGVGVLGSSSYGRSGHPAHWQRSRSVLLIHRPCISSSIVVSQLLSISDGGRSAHVIGKKPHDLYSYWGKRDRGRQGS